MRIFVSYQGEDIAAAKRIGDALTDRGQDVVLHECPLDDPITLISEQLRVVDLLLIFVGRTTYQSSWVAAEILAAKIRNLPMITVLFDEESAAPDTLPLHTPVLAYPSLLKTQFALFDVLPSRLMAAAQWKKARRKIDVYQHPEQKVLPEPLVDRKSLTNRVLLVAGFVGAFASYWIGAQIPMLLYFAYCAYSGREPFPMTSQLENMMYWTQLIWWVPFTLILFWKPKTRLAYPLWILWFFRQYVPAWLSTRRGALQARLPGIMRRLSAASGNVTYWNAVIAHRTGANAEGRQLPKELFLLLSRDERRSGPYGEFDEMGLSEIHALINNITDFDLGRYSRPPVLVERSPEEVEVFSPQCPAPFCLCGKVVRLKKLNDRWQVISRNW